MTITEKREQQLISVKMSLVHLMTLLALQTSNILKAIFSITKPQRRLEFTTPDSI
jgi:hypothetical protein